MNTITQPKLPRNPLAILGTWGCEGNESPATFDSRAKVLSNCEAIAIGERWISMVHINIPAMIFEDNDYTCHEFVILGRVREKYSLGL